MATIAFTDATGAATLQSAWPAPANRLRSWKPRPRPFGEGSGALGDGKYYKFRFRTDYTASFEFVGIANTDVDIAQRLIDHLESGGVCTVNTGDASSNSYTNCCLVKDAEPELELDDRQMLEYVLRLTITSLDATAPLVCEYP